MQPRQIKSIQARSRNLEVLPLSLNRLVVQSQTDDLHSHVVTVEFLPDGELRTSCSCEWSHYKGVACTHVMAALEHLASMKGRKLSFWLTENDAKRQKQRIFYMSSKKNPDTGVWITSRADKSA